MSKQPTKHPAKVKKNDKREAKRESALEEPVDEGVQPWKNIFRPTCAQPPKDNNFTLDDEGAAASVENVLSSFTVSDPNEEGNPLCYVSPAFLSMTGYSEQECLGKNCKFLQGGKLDPGTQESLHACLTERRVATVEVTNYRKDGRQFQNLLTLAPVLGGDGTNLLHFVGVQCDLDERRRRGEAVDDAFVSRWQEQARNCLSAFALIDVSGGGSAAASASASTSGGVGPAGAGPAQGSTSASRVSTAPSASSPSAAAVCAVSPGFTALTGYSQSDVMGWNLLCLCGPESAERDMRKLITAQWAHTPTVVKLLCYKRDGTPFWALVLSYPLTRVHTAPAAPAAQGAPAVATGLVSAAAAAQATAAGRVGVGAGAAGRGAQAGGGAQGRTGTLGLGLLSGGLLSGVAGGGGGLGLLGGLSSNAVGIGAAGAGAGGAAAAAATQPSVKYCLCCIVDITAQRLKKVVGGKYVLGKVIGAGAFGLVRIGKNTTTDELVAVKGVDATRFRNITELDQIQEEMSVLSSLKHPNIIRLFDVHFQSNTFFLVMEFAGNGSLVHFMRSQGDPVRRCLDEGTAGRVFVQMVGALDYCHRRRIVHRDLKPENILMDENNNLKIADFGLAAVAAPFSGGLTLQCGTPEFTAPEITIGREYDGPSVDIWSMGVILYEALCGSLPFKGTNQAALFKAIQKGSYDPLPAHISQECKDLVRRMLVVDPSARIKMEEILRHPWVIKAAAALAATSSRPAGATSSPSQPEAATADGAAAAADPLSALRYSSSGAAAPAGGFPASVSSSGTGNGLAEGSRPGSAAWRNGAVTGSGGGARSGATARISDSSGPGPNPLASNSRPTSAGLGGVPVLAVAQVPGPPSPVGPQAPIGLPHTDDSPSGALHDSVKLVIPSQVDRDDPILAAILRSHVSNVGDAAHVRAPGDDGDDGDHSQPSPQSYAASTLATGGRRDPVSSSSSSNRVGPSGRGMGGMASGAAGSLHGQAQGNGKSRGGALLPTLGGGANGQVVLDSSGRHQGKFGSARPGRGDQGGPHSMHSGPPEEPLPILRRMQDPTRFRSPARGGQAPGPGAGVRGGPGGGGPVSRTQPSSQAGAPPSPHAGQSPHGGHTYMPADGAGGGRQLPPIQNNRGALNKKSSWMPGQS